MLQGTFSLTVTADRSAPPSLLPDLFPDRAAHARLLVRCMYERALWCSARDLADQFSADRLIEILSVLDGHHKGARTSDNTILIIPVEVIDIHRRIRWLLHHDRQAIDDDALRQRLIASGRDEWAAIVRTVARNVDDASQSSMRVLVEQRHREQDGARDRGARSPSDRRLHDFVGDGIGRLGSVDHAPGNDDLLVAGR